MNNTALRAGAQSANNTHMVFANEEHEKFYFEKLEQARYQDCYHKALIYILGISEDTRNHFSQIYDIKSGYIKTECLHQGWQTSGSVRVVRLAFNLYTDGTPSVDDYKRKDEQIGVELEKEIKNKSVLREKQQAEETYLAEKAKLDKALAMELMSQSEYEVKLAIAKKKYDNFEEIRKVQQLADMNLITKEEKEAKIKELTE